MAVVGVSWHRDLPAHLYSGGFLFTHEHLSRGPKSGSAVWAGGWHRAGLLPAGALSRLVFFGGEGWAYSNLNSDVDKCAVGSLLKGDFSV